MKLSATTLVCLNHECEELFDGSVHERCPVCGDVGILLARYFMPTYFKQCSCGKKYTKEQWDALPFVGVWPRMIDGLVLSHDDLELRTCLCGSTIAVPMKKEPE